MPKQKYDLNDNGKIDPEEREIMLEDRRRMMEDADAKRDAQLRMTWFALSGMVLYPFAIVLASWMGLEQASMLPRTLSMKTRMRLSGSSKKGTPISFLAASLGGMSTLT